jgi:hypothetical protein
MVFYGAPPPTDQTLQQVTAALPAVLDAFAPTDAVQAVGVYTAKIANMRRMKRTFPLLATFYDNEIAKLRAKLKAAKRKVALQKEGEGATRQWRGLGQSAIIAGVALLLGLTTLAVVRTRQPPTFKLVRNRGRRA